MNSINKLTELFKKFPGIGPRQAGRFVYFLLSQNESFIREFTQELGRLRDESVVCKSCFRFFSRNSGTSELCSICSNKDRDLSKLLIVSQDADLESVEKAGIYDGLYFVLGGTVPVLDKEPEKRIRIKELMDILGKRSGVSEIILAMNANTEGENTTEYIERELSKSESTKKIKISHLGRGLSTGSELEYSDKDTLANALKNRG